MQEYVLGFMFDQEAEHVALICKRKPKWQEGLLNGIGGKVEYNETPYVAMVREFQEETGVWWDCWNPLAVMQEEGIFKVHVFYTFSDNVYDVSTMEWEVVSIFSVYSDWKYIVENSVSNVPWLLMSCLDEDCQSGRLKLRAAYGD